MEITKYEARIAGISPISQGKYHGIPKKDGETYEDHEDRTWRERMHATSDGVVFIPPMAFKNALSSAAKYLSMKIPGEGKKTYTKKFESGVLCSEPVVLDGILKDEVPRLKLFVPSDGKRGGSSRVMKNFPAIPKWGGILYVDVLDPIIKLEVLEKHLEVAGYMIGVGALRVENNGYFGRFKVERLRVIES